MCGGAHDVITGNKFHENRSRGFRATGARKLGLPLTWPVALTTVQHYRADCDTPFFMLFMLTLFNIGVLGKGNRYVRRRVGCFCDLPRTENDVISEEKS